MEARSGSDRVVGAGEGVKGRVQQERRERESITENTEDADRGSLGSRDKEMREIGK